LGSPAPLPGTADVPCSSSDSLQGQQDDETVSFYDFDKHFPTNRYPVHIYDEPTNFDNFVAGYDSSNHVDKEKIREAMEAVVNEPFPGCQTADSI
jgi:hypothetical protein